MDTVGLPLKMFVIGAGVLLLLGTIVLAVLVVLGIQGDRPEPARAPLEAALPAEPVSLPAGARIQQIVPDPAGGPLVLLGSDGDDVPFLALIDLERGVLVRLIRFDVDRAP